MSARTKESSVTLRVRVTDSVAVGIAASACENGGTVSGELRTAIDSHLARDIVAPRERPVYRMCVYCGRPCYGLTCSAHSHLPALDPGMAKGIR